MYLSKLILNPDSRQVRIDLADPYEMHRTVMKAFPDRTEGGPGRVLFRLEPAKSDRAAVVLVQSMEKPDWSEAKETGYAFSVDSKEYEPSFREGQVLRFRLKANPTVRRKTEKNGNLKSARHGLYKHEEQMEWLRGKKASRHGFQVLDVRIVESFNQKSKKGRHTHFSVRFEGLLKVSDPEDFAEAVANGVGPAKGYGFGLLSVAPA